MKTIFRIFLSLCTFMASSTFVSANEKLFDDLPGIGFYAGPVITVGAVSGNITACAGTASVDPAIQQFVVSGIDLTDNIIVNAPADFQVSTNAGSGYASSLVLTQVGGVVSNTTIYVRSASSAPSGPIAGNVSLTTIGGTPQDAAVAGTVNPIPNAIATPASQSKCSGNAITTISLTGNVPGTVFNWTRNNTGAATGIAANGTGDISGTLNNTTNAPVTVTFTITPTANGCVGSSITATVLVNPVVSGFISGPANVQKCAGQSSSVNINVSGVAPFHGVFSITLISGIGTPTASFDFNTGVVGNSAVTIPAANLTNTSSSSTLYRVTWVSLFDANGCPAVSITGSANITVFPVPAISATLVNPAGDICPGTSIVYDVANPNGIPGSLFNWEARDDNGAGAILGSANNVAFGNGAVNTTLGLSCPVAHTNGIQFRFTPVGPAPLGCTGTTVTNTVNVRDIVAPSLNTPGSLPGGALGNVCLADAPAAPSAASIKLLYSDNCSSQAELTITGPVTNTTGTCVWTRTYAYTITDLCGNETVANVIYSGADSGIPTWTTANGTLNTTIQCTNDAAAFAAKLSAAQNLVPVATDNCASAGTLSANLVKTAGTFAVSAAGSCTTAGTYTNSFITTDGCGNTSTIFTQVITIVDNTPPTLSSPAPQSLNVGAGAGCSVIIPDYIPLVMVTDCSPTTASQSPAAGTTIFGIGGSQIVTITVTDGCGNVSTRDITINLVDATPPVARCHDITVHLNASGSASIIPSQIDGDGPGPSFDPKSSDNCGLASFNGGLTFQGPFDAPNTSTVWNFACNKLGLNSIVLVVTDASGNQATCNATVNVLDVIPPVITCPGNQVIPKGSSCTNILSDLRGTVSANDACGAVTIDQSPAPGTVIGSNISNLPVSITVTDGSGNSTTCIINVNFADLTPPVLSACPANITVSNGVGNTSCSVAVSWTPPTASDNCSPALGATTVSSTHSPGDQFSAGTTTVTYTATDFSGNTSTCSFTVTVIDNTPPTIFCQSPGNKTVSASSGSCTYIHSGSAWDASGSDNCMPLIAATYTLSGTTSGSGSSLNNVAFNPGTTTVTWSVTDQSNNSTTCSFTVTVSDNIAPVITCPATVNINTNAAGCNAIVPGATTTPTYSDNCSITLVEWSVSGATPVASGTGNMGTYNFNLGTSQVTYRVSDAVGNSTTCSFNVIVTNAVAGTINGTTTVGQHPTNTSPVTFTGSGGTANYIFTYNINGGATQTVATTGGSNVATVSQSNATIGTFTYNLLSVTDANGCPGTLTGPTSATITVTGGTKDLTNSQFFSTTQIGQGGTIEEVIGIRNVGTIATSAPIVFSVTNYSPITGISATSNNNATVTIGFTTYNLDNANWTVTSSSSALTFTSNPGVIINPSQTRFLGVRITRVAGANGMVTHSSTISSGTGGGETPSNNNTISNTVLKN